MSQADFVIEAGVLKEYCGKLTLYVEKYSYAAEHAKACGVPIQYI